MNTDCDNPPAAGLEPHAGVLSYLPWKKSCVYCLIVQPCPLARHAFIDGMSAHQIDGSQNIRAGRQQHDPGQYEDQYAAAYGRPDPASEYLDTLKLLG